MFCHICQKEIKPEIGEQMAGDCIYREFRCPKHHNILATKIIRRKKIKGWLKIGEIIKKTAEFKRRSK